MGVLRWPARAVQSLVSVDSRRLGSVITMFQTPRNLIHSLDFRFAERTEMTMTRQWHEEATTSGLCLVPPMSYTTNRIRDAKASDGTDRDCEPTLGHPTYGECAGPKSTGSRHQTFQFEDWIKRVARTEALQQAPKVLTTRS